ncbi:alpha-amylase family glycosyl hydrolase [Agriterribacter sp.]|uniref:alpha-amylase family glycosyl hydrolase n=1 Tax=Agriterribacter sp. TaxID=2821509 RepID=UPI002D0AE284|nr:alpha-amylase family glycosyl hydrolase [Agriterribacter sp.]HRO44712.1 alpha-amylase family glycosyl hydrolase [Agriterribacter sp.]HRQ16385.1 alpha-amylase family glycosyl hydrolase [Agriterribacter sp.]
MHTEHRRVAWRHHTNVYEINLRQYTKEGTFNAFAGELPRLRKMGVETLWFMPVTPIAKEKMKGTMGSYYACSDYTAVNPEFGTLDDFKKLVRLAHQLGFKVIIDWVANHTGWDHVWTKTHPEYYKRDEAGNFKAASGMDDIIELDFNNPDLVKAMIDAMTFWIKECDIDGFRCDLAFWVELDFWRKARPALDQVKPLFWLGEFDALDNPEYLEVFDAAYAWTWMHKTEDFYKKQRHIPALENLLQQYKSVFLPGTTGLYFTSNHDENSWNGTEFEKYGDMAPALAVFSCTWDGIPLLYSGQELPNLKRLQFFDKDVIEWNGTYALEAFYRKLLTLRAENPALASGNGQAETTILDFKQDEHILGYVRKCGVNAVLVLMNLSPYPSRFMHNDSGITGKYTESFTGEEKDCSANQWFELAPWGYKVYVT